MSKEAFRGKESAAELQFVVLKPPEQVDDPEILDAVTWYKEKLGELPEMRVTKSPITDGINWTEKREEDKLDEVNSGFFSAEGLDVQKGTFNWHQMMLRQRSEELIAQDGQTEEISGVVLLLRDPEGKVFIIVDQEPG